MQAVPQAQAILASLGQAAFVWDIAADAIAWSDNAAAVFADIPPEALASGSEFAKLIEPSRSIRTEALSHTPPARSGEGVPYRIEYGVRASTSAPVHLDRGDRLLVCRSRRQADARARHRPHQQRAPRPRRAAAETVAARSADRRTQPHPSGGFAGRSDRGDHALPHLLRLHADRHRPSGAGQRRLRLRRRGCRHRRSGAAHSHRGCAAATCSAASPATSSA